MRSFNIELYAQSAEGALRRIRDATCVDEDGLRMIAADELHGLKRRYGNNGYWKIQVDQRAAQALSPKTGKGTG
jgi:hypothetical protein